jgi:hypothetical protein
MEGWYNVTHQKVAGNGGSRLITLFGSHYNVIKAAFPDYDWKDYKFKRKPAKYYGSEESIRDSIRLAEENLQIQSPSAWYGVTNKQLRQLGIYYNIMKHGGLYKILSQLYPSENWDYKRLAAHPFLTRRAAEKQAKVSVERLLTDEHVVKEPIALSDIYYNIRPPTFRNRNERDSVELDIYIPRLKLALEYQGRQHYEALLEPSNNDSTKLEVHLK